MDEASSTPLCTCGIPERAAASDHIPVEFDVQMNEYHLVRDGAQTVMRYCCWCGGRLPESKRGSYFTTPDQAEMAEVRSLLAGAHSLADVVRILGPPDEVLERSGRLGNLPLGSTCRQSSKGEVVERQVAPGRPGAIYARWKRVHRYSKRWTSLIVEVPEVLEAPFNYAIRGHPLSGPPG